MLLASVLVLKAACKRFTGRFCLGIKPLSPFASPSHTTPTYSHTPPQAAIATTKPTKSCCKGMALATSVTSIITGLHDHVDLPQLAIVLCLGIRRGLLHLGLALAQQRPLGHPSLVCGRCDWLPSAVAACVCVVFCVHPLWLFHTAARRFACAAHRISSLWRVVGLGFHCLPHDFGLPRCQRREPKRTDVVGLVAPNGHTTKLPALAACEFDHHGVVGRVA